MVVVEALLGATVAVVGSGGGGRSNYDLFSWVLRSFVEQREERMRERKNKGMRVSIRQNQRINLMVDFAKWLDLIKPCHISTDRNFFLFPLENNP